MAASSLCNSSLALRSCNRKTQLRRVCLENVIAALFFFCGEGPRSRCYGPTAALRLIVQPCDEDEEKEDQFFLICPSNWATVEWNWQGKTEVLGGKTCPSATLSITNPTWTDPGLNPSLRGERRIRLRWEDNIKMGIQGIGCGRGCALDWSVSE